MLARGSRTAAGAAWRSAVAGQAARDASSSARRLSFASSSLKPSRSTASSSSSISTPRAQAYSFSTSRARQATQGASTQDEPVQAAPPTDGEKQIAEKLRSAFDGAVVEVLDVSGGCGSFYAITVAHSSFKGLTTIKQHRAVNSVLADEIKDVHGIQLRTAPL